MSQGGKKGGRRYTGWFIARRADRRHNNRALIPREASAKPPQHEDQRLHPPTGRKWSDSWVSSLNTSIPPSTLVMSISHWTTHAADFPMHVTWTMSHACTHSRLSLFSTISTQRQQVTGKEREGTRATSTQHRFTRSDLKRETKMQAKGGDDEKDLPPQKPHLCSS